MTSGDITIREATPTDFADVALMHYPVWRRSWTGIVPELVLNLFELLNPPRRWPLLEYPQDLSRPGWTMWIAESGGQVLGMTIFGPDADDADQLEIDALYIAEGSQRHGIGGRLLGKVLNCNAGDVVLWCAEQNGAARRFYEKFDFHADGRTLDWEPLPGVKVPHLGYRLRRLPRLTHQ